MIYDGYVINPDSYLLPHISVSPFKAEDIQTNRKLLPKGLTQKYFQAQYNQYNNYITENGRQALDIALSQLGLKRTDVVTILTTTQNFYISSCVTATIENYCLWNRNIDQKTKAILVNHEFGYCYENLSELKKYNLPIIEDCAHSFNSNNTLTNAGRVGDYVIFSFPKFFPIQVGGALLSRVPVTSYKPDAVLVSYVDAVVGHFLDDVSAFSRTKVANYNQFVNKLTNLDIRERIKLTDKTVPGVFLFRLPESVDPAGLKKFFFANGVECSVFYGENSFFLPCHQRIDFDEIDYMCTLLGYFINSIN